MRLAGSAGGQEGQPAAGFTPKLASPFLNHVLSQHSISGIIGASCLCDTPISNSSARSSARRATTLKVCPRERYGDDE